MKVCATTAMNATAVITNGIWIGIVKVRASIIVIAISPLNNVTSAINNGNVRKIPLMCHHWPKMSPKNGVLIDTQ
jgi:hypothetical protein